MVIKTTRLWQRTTPSLPPNWNPVSNAITVNFIFRHDQDTFALFQSTQYVRHFGNGCNNLIPNTNVSC